MAKKIDTELIARKFEALNAFARGAAHDINNILTSLSGNIALAQMYAENDPQATLKKLAECEIALERAKDFTSNMVALTQGEPTLKSITATEGLVKGTLEAALKDTEVTTELDFPTDLFSAKISEEDVCRAITKIIENAVKATEGNGTLRIKGSNKTVGENEKPPLPGGDYAVISISDNGPGIAPEALDRIFDPYFTTDKRAKGRELSYAYAIIKEQGGLIDVEPGYGTGAAFHIYLPVADGSEDEDELFIAKPVEKPSAKSTARADTPAAEPTTKATKARILVLSSGGIMKDLLSELLSPMGYSLSFGESEEEVLRAFKEKLATDSPFDMVIMDIAGPCGGETLSAVGKIKDASPEVKAVISSADTEDPVFIDFASNGFDAAISKPYNMSELTTILDKLVRSE